MARVCRSETTTAFWKGISMTMSNTHTPRAAIPLTMPHRCAGKPHEDLGRLHHTSHTSLSSPHTSFPEWFTHLSDGPGQEVPWPLPLPSFPMHSVSCPLSPPLSSGIGTCPSWHLVQATILFASVLAPYFSPTCLSAFLHPAARRPPSKWH